MTKFAIVDLEATDAHLSQNKIIQIGLVILEDGQIKESYSKNINPHEELTPHISSLTGLTDDILSQAVDFSEVAQEVYDLLKDSIFVAHNVKFDYSLMKKSFRELGIDFELPSADTVELSRVFFPDFEKYSLEYLGQKLDLGHDNPHNALSDALATAKLLQLIQDKIKSLPKPVVEEILRHAGNLIYESQLVIKDVFNEMSADDAIKTNHFMLEGALATRILPQAKESLNLVSSYDKNMNELGLAPRKNQAELASIVESDLLEKRPSFIQAQTGMGKTYAYLLPILSRGEKIIVATPTKTLQEQLVADYQEEFSEHFGVNISKLLGHKNYIKLEKFKPLLKATNSGANHEIFKMKVLVWLCQTETGELDELSKIMTADDYLKEIAHDGSLDKKSAFYQQDFLRKAYEKTEFSSVLVINQALMIEKLRTNQAFFKGRVLVVDEAQELFKNLENSQRQTFDWTTVEEDLKLHINKDNSDPNLLRRVISSLNFHINHLPQARDKILVDAREFGLKNLLDFFGPVDASVDDSYIWKQGDYLYKSPKDFLNFKGLLPDELKVYLIGATLSISQKNHKLPELLGFTDYSYDELMPQRANNQEIYVVTDGPNIGNLSNANLAAYTFENITRLIPLGQPILVLLTSKDLLHSLSDLLAEDDCSFLAQGLHGNPMQLKKRFDEGRAQVLLGLASFWEGIDFSEQDKIILLIPRLPFSTPEDILMKKYAEKFANPFYDFNLPLTTLRLRQALGRVNRRNDQKSVVLILDRRLAGKNYGKKICANLSQLAPINFEEIAGLEGKIKKNLL
ncbi:exonuclease domain-containing protein [Streptococcaceae bacterium ESL0729]|nr:exonuclease domain-containing protein [Streptococcaceae bacterium ESL0729]